MLIDPRGPRVAAAITAVVLAAVLLTGSVWLLTLQTAVFALGAVAGIQRTPYSAFFRRVIRPRLSPPRELESAAPPRFAQGVGFAFGIVGLAAFTLDATVVALVVVGLAFGAAFLNAVFGFCLGCEIYLLAKRATSPRHVRSVSKSHAASMKNISSKTTTEEITA